MDTISNRLFNQRVWGRGLRKSAVLVVTLALLLLFAGKGQIVHAASLTVTTTNDELNSDGDCSLREAIQATNTDAAVDACTAGSGADIIVVPAGTYILSSGELGITTNLTINGAGAATTIIDGAGLSRVFHIFSTTATISGVTIRNGFEIVGGGISNFGTLTLKNSSVSANNAGSCSGGIDTHGTLTLEQSTVSGNTAGSHSGGIFNGGTLTLTNSTVSGNTVTGPTGSAGGILNFFGATATLTNSTVSGNTVSGNSEPNSGGGIDNRAGATLRLVGSTVSGNTAVWGGGIYNTGTVSITHSTIKKNTVTANGGGIHNREGGVVTVDRSTITGNSALSGGGVDNSIGPTPGTVTITASQVSGNTASLDGGGISNKTGTVTLDGSTVTRNTASQGGGITNWDSLFLVNSVVTGNSATSGPVSGGGIYNSDSLFLTNSVVAGNSATSDLGSGGGIFNDGGVVTLTKSKVRGNRPDDCVGC
jgi:CSLREA domain-containing protein